MRGTLDNNGPYALLMMVRVIKLDRHSQMAQAKEKGPGNPALVQCGPQSWSVMLHKYFTTFESGIQLFWWRINY